MVVALPDMTRRLMNVADAAGSRGTLNFNRAVAGALTLPEPPPLCQCRVL
ncbi:hypothetical protein [Streptomyces sp. NPDC054787]